MSNSYEYEYGGKGIGYGMYHGMLKNRNEIAQIEAVSGLKDTHGSLLERCVHVALGLLKRGVTRKDIVSTCSSNHLNNSVPFIACQFIGVPFATLDPNLSSYETTYLLKLVKPRFIFVERESITLIEEALNDCGEEVSPQIVVFGQSTNDSYLELEDFVGQKSDVDSFVPIVIEDPKTELAVIHFSSGTTGMPKGICLSHHALTLAAANCWKLGKSTVLLIYSTSYWITATIAILASAFHGFARVLVAKFDASKFWKYVERYNVTIAVVVTTFSTALCEYGPPDDVSTKSLWLYVVIGESFSVSTLEKFRKQLPNTFVMSSYGSTELLGSVLSFPLNNKKDIENLYTKIGSSGCPGEMREVRVVDPETENVLGPNQPGELRVKTEIKLLGYYQQDSTDIFDKDGWFKTGDLVYYDEDSYYYVVDRVKELIKYRNFHVPPAMIEQSLLEHPKVQSAVVVGIPNNMDGEHPAAVIILKNGAISSDLVEFEEWVEKLGNNFKLRGGVKIVKCLPTTPTGKINRKEVRKLFC